MYGKTLNKYSPRSLKRFKFLIALIILTVASVALQAQDFNKSFRVLPDSSLLEVITKTGSVTIVPGESNIIQITARRTGANITATQASSQGKVRVEISENTPVDLAIYVPATASLDVLCVRCGVTIRGIRGTIKTSTTEGNIQLTGIRSSLVEARSMSGNVSYTGEILASGSYFLKSFSGRVEAFLPAGSKFKLDATSARGGIEIDPVDFQLTVQKQTSQFVHGLVGSDGATLTLWTQEGSIRVKKK